MSLDLNDDMLKQVQERDEARDDLRRVRVAKEVLEGLTQNRWKKASRARDKLDGLEADIEWEIEQLSIKLGMDY